METAGSLSSGVRGGTRSGIRWIVLGALLPVLAGLGATVAIWQGLDHDVVQPPPAAEPALLHNGSVLVFSPLTSAPMTVAVGQQLELQVGNQRGLHATSSDADVLGAVPQPACLPEWPCSTGVYVADFVARHPGTASIALDYGTGCVPTPCRMGILTKTITVVARPQMLPIR
jgi:hypothetical protein